MALHSARRGASGIMPESSRSRQSAVAFSSASAAAPSPKLARTAAPSPVAAPASTKEAAAPSPVAAPTPQPGTSEAKVIEKVDTVLVQADSDDVTKIPTILDQKYEELDEDSALRPTIINFGGTWTKKSQKALLSPLLQNTLNNPEQTTEKNRAFDLLDALSRSGSLPIDFAALHVVILATHSFVNSLVSTVIEDNMNPIEKVERSTLILATTIQGKTAAELIRPEQVQRVATYSVPKLFIEGQKAVASASIVGKDEKVHA